MNGRTAGLSGVMCLGLGITLAACSSSSTASTTTTTAAKSTTTTTAAKSTTTTTSAGGHGLSSPQAVGAAFVTAINTKNFAGFCAIAAPGQEGACTNTIAGLTSGAATLSNWALGTVTTQGDQAIINFTGTACAGEQCASNGDVNSAQSDGSTFAKAFAVANNSNDPNSSPFATAAVRVNGAWYASGF
jgi:hypothetical protein